MLIENNLLLNGASGMLGNQIVVRQSRGKIIMCNRPKKRGELTVQQVITKDKFLEAVQYAKIQSEDPIAGAEYLTGITDKLVSAYAVALTDYLKGPEIKNVDTSHYTGLVGSMVEVKATDNFKVTKVNIRITDANGALLEEGLAIQSAINIFLWHYNVTSENLSVPGSKIVVTARDKANNVTIQEVVL